LPVNFFDLLAQTESNNQNIYSKVDPDVAGPNSRSQGYFQINTPTWAEFAPKVGIDLNKYPNAMSAPRDVQMSVAGAIPFSRFGPRTQKIMAGQFGDLDTSKTVGALAGNTSTGSTASTTPGTTLNTTPATAAASPAQQSPLQQITGAVGSLDKQFRPEAAAPQAMQAPNLQPHLPTPQASTQMMAQLMQQNAMRPKIGGLGGLGGTNPQGMSPQMLLQAGINPYTMGGING
jgi:hypothetical protein